MVKPLRNGRRRDKRLQRAAKSAAWWRHKLIVDPAKLTEPVWKNSATLVHVFSAAGAPPSVLTQPSSPHNLNFSGNHLIAEALVRMRHTQYDRDRSWPFFWLWGFLDQHIYFCSGLHTVPLYWQFTSHASAGREACCSGSHSTSGLC